MTQQLAEYALAIFIIVCTKIVLVIAFILHLPVAFFVIIREAFDQESINLVEYSYNTLRSTDIILSSMFFGTERATISGWSYYLGEKRGSNWYKKFYKFIDILAFDETHCMDAYIYETTELNLREYRENPWVKH